MKRTMIVAVTAAIVLAVLAFAAARWLLQQQGGPGEATPSSAAAGEVHASLLYGRVTTITGGTYEGRLRFGGDEEAFWGDYFNGVKAENPWPAHAPLDRLPKERGILDVLGFGFGQRERPIDFQRPFMVRFGNIARIDGQRDDVRVILKSGAVSKLNRFDASDFDDGVQVWDASRGVVNLDNKWIRSIELLPSPRSGAAPHRLYGTMHTRHGKDFTGFLQWDRQETLGGDTLDGSDGGRNVSLRFDTIRSIARHSRESARVTLIDGREIVLSGTSDVGRRNRGTYVDDPRYGRVLISWDAFERVDLSADVVGRGGSGPTYDDFPPGHPLTGVLATRDGRRLSGRLVFDLDESETIETLDAPSEGVDYTIPFGLIASIVRGGTSTVILHSGEELQLERTGDLGNGNAGMLIFVDGSERPEYVRWTDVQEIDFDRPPAMYPPIDER